MLPLSIALVLFALPSRYSPFIFSIGEVTMHYKETYIL